MHFGRYYGFSIKRYVVDGKAYLSGVIWFRRAPKRLGYWYPSIRWF
jgi:hypothetical protein